jgi:regulator of sirC expression with transglutaminase-like and TPR domain
MLRNLKGIYLHLNKDLQSFEMLQWILAVDPHAPGELKERGLLYETMGNSAFAVRDLERYLVLVPDAEDKEKITLKIDQLRQTRGWLH